MDPCENITLGLGDLYINGRHAGFLDGKVDYSAEYEIKEFYSGVPKQLICQIPIQIKAGLSAGLAELSAENLSSGLGQLPIVTQTAGTSTVADGANEEHTFALDPTTGKRWFRLGPGFGLANAFTSVVLKDLTEADTFVVVDDYTVDLATGIVTWVADGDIPDLATVRTAYGYSTIAGKQIKLGAIFTLADVEIAFCHTKPNGAKKIWVVMPRATVTGKIGLSFSADNIIVNQVSFNALRSPLVRYASCPLGYTFNES